MKCYIKQKKLADIDSKIAVSDAKLSVLRPFEQYEQTALQQMGWSPMSTNRQNQQLHLFILMLKNGQGLFCKAAKVLLHNLHIIIYSKMHLNHNTCFSRWQRVWFHTESASKAIGIDRIANSKTKISTVATMSDSSVWRGSFLIHSVHKCF